MDIYGNIQLEKTKLYLNKYVWFCILKQLEQCYWYKIKILNKSFHQLVICK